MTDEAFTATVSRLAAASGFAPDFRLVLLAGDASTRRYLRLVTSSGRTAVVMDCGGPVPERDPVRGVDAFTFTRWRDAFAALGVRVPAVLGEDRRAGILLLEDLGDEMLQHRVEARGASPCAPLYLEAVAIARRLSEEGTRRFPPAAPDADDPMTAARLALELDLFLVHALAMPFDSAASAAGGMEALRAASAALEQASPAVAAVRLILRELCEDVHRPLGASTGGGLVLCHRDFHARNLIVVRDESRPGGEALAVIDFQDARRGPRAYDLASLAWDPYVDLPCDLVEQLIEAARPEGVAAEAWSREVDLAGGQRLLKAAGSYAFLDRVRGLSTYRRWFAPAMNRAFERLAHWEHAADLRQALSEAGLRW